MSDCCIELIVSEETPVELQVCEQDQIGLEIKEQIVYGGGGIIPVGTKTIEVTENGTVTDDVTYYAAVEIDVDVPNTYEAGDEGKVVDDGALVSQSSTNITTNGTYDTTLNNEAIVAVPASAVDTGTKNITHNGNGQDVVGYAAVNVAVPNSYAVGDEGKVVSSGALVSQGSAEYTENGTYDTTLISSVEVAVPGDAPSGTKQIEITENGTNTENVAGYAYAEIEVAVPNSYAADDEGKVVDDGELVAQTSLGVNENGTYDTTLNNQVVVSVPNTYAAGDEGKVVSNGELVSQGSATYTSNNTYDTTLIDEVTVNVSGGGSPNLQTVSKTYTPTESQQTEQITPGTGYDGLAEVDVTVNAISSSYVGSGVTRRSSTDLSESGGTVTAPAGYYAESASKAVAAGTAGTPVATKGAVSNHSIDVTPSVTNSAGYVASETKTGTAVTVTASELESGTKSITANGTNIDVTGYAAVDVNVSGGGGLTNDQFVDHAYPQGAFATSYSGTLKSETFKERTGITSFVGNGITTISGSAFYGCTALETVSLPNVVSASGTYMFQGCNSLKGIVLPSITGDIMGHAFIGCSALKYIDLGPSFGRLNASDALQSCSSLDMLVIRRTTVSPLNNINNFNNTPFASGGSGGTLYVPASLLSSYEAASGWSTILGYTNNQIKSIESTHTDPTAPIDLTLYYADGTPIS